MSYETYILKIMATEEVIDAEEEYLFDWSEGFRERLEVFLIDEAHRCSVKVEITVRSKADAEDNK